MHNSFKFNIGALIAGIPQKLIVIFGKVIGTIAFNIDIRHRRIVRRNLSFVYSDWSNAKINSHSLEVFQNFGIFVMELCQLFFLPKEKILKKVNIRGEKEIKALMESDKGAVLISAHLGNWELMSFFIPCYFNKPVIAVAKKIRPAILNRFIVRLRTRFGNEMIDKKKGLSKMSAVLSRKEKLGILIDQSTSRAEGVEVKFFNHTVTATPAAALLAMRHRCKVVLLYCVREGKGYTFIAEPVDLVRTNNLRADLKANTQIMTYAIEKAVKKYSQQWFWFHKKWKRHHPELYSEDIAKRQKRRRKKRSTNVFTKNV